MIRRRSSKVSPESANTCAVATEPSSSSWATYRGYLARDTRHLLTHRDLTDLNPRRAFCKLDLSPWLLLPRAATLGQPLWPSWLPRPLPQKWQQVQQGSPVLVPWMLSSRIAPKMLVAKARCGPSAGWLVLLLPAPAEHCRCSCSASVWRRFAFVPPVPGTTVLRMSAPRCHRLCKSEFTAREASGLKGSQGFFQEIEPSIKTFGWQRSPLILLSVVVILPRASQADCIKFSHTSRTGASAILSCAVGHHSKGVCINMQLCRTTNSCRTVRPDWTSWISHPCMCSICRKQRRANFQCCVVVITGGTVCNGLCPAHGRDHFVDIYHNPPSITLLTCGLSKGCLGRRRPLHSSCKAVQHVAAWVCNELGFPLWRAVLWACCERSLKSPWSRKTGRALVYPGVGTASHPKMPRSCRDLC